jgi:hypothetical protein
MLPIGKCKFCPRIKISMGRRCRAHSETEHPVVNHFPRASPNGGLGPQTQHMPGFGPHSPGGLQPPTLQRNRASSYGSFPRSVSREVKARHPDPPISKRDFRPKVQNLNGEAVAISKRDFRLKFKISGERRASAFSRVLIPRSCELPRAVNAFLLSEFLIDEVKFTSPSCDALKVSSQHLFLPST